MMAIIGWIAVALVLFNISSGYMYVMSSCMGTYTIGGGLNSHKLRFLVFLGFLVIVSAWVTFFIHMPFSISFK